MQRGFLSVARLALPVAFAGVVLAIALTVFGAPAPPPVSAALHDAKLSSYSNVIVVARAGGDFTSVKAAVHSITDNSPANRYLVWVAPGIYTETVVMKQYVDIEGAGEKATKIVSTRIANSATLYGASNAELRYLTVESRSSSTPAIWNDNASPSLLHVTAISSPPTSEDMDITSDASPDIAMDYGIRNTSASAPLMVDVTVSTTVELNALGYGIYNDTSSPMMKNVTISISGGNIANYGVYNNNSTSTMQDVTIFASGGTGNYGVYNNHSTSTIDGSAINALNATIGNDPSSVARVGASKLAGGPVSGTLATCAGVYDENYTFYPSTCP
jgi:hypothetical protein